MCQTEHCYVAIEELMPNNRFCSKNWQRLDWSETEDLSSVERFPPSQKQQRKKVFPPFLETLIEHTCNHITSLRRLWLRVQTQTVQNQKSARAHGKLSLKYVNVSLKFECPPWDTKLTWVKCESCWASIAHTTVWAYF